MSLPNTIINDFFLEVARGNVTGYSALELKGLNADIDAGTEDVWNQGGNITQSDTPIALCVSSTSALDVSQYVQITGLDSNYDEITETIGMLTGVTKVVGTKLFIRVNGVALVAAPDPIVPVTTPAIVYVSSTSAADTTPLAVTVTGTDANDAVIHERIVLTGQTRAAGTLIFKTVTSAVLSAACAGKVYVFYASTVTLGVPDTESKIQAVLSTDTLNVAAGIVYVARNTAVGGGGVPTDTTQIQAKIEVGDLTPFNAIYTVPRNKNLYLTSLRYRSAGQLVHHEITILLKKALFGAAAATVKVIEYTGSATATHFVGNQIQFTDQPVVFPAKSELRFTGTLPGGASNLNLALEANLILEDITDTPNTATVLTNAGIVAKMATAGTTNVSQNHWLIGLDEVPGPNVIPTTINLDDVLATITGKGHLAGVIRPYVAANTEVAFDPAYFTSGVLVSTTKKAVFTVMRCVDSAGTIDYVQAPSNMIFSLGNCKKINYLTQ